MREAGENNVLDVVFGEVVEHLFKILLTGSSDRHGLVVISDLIVIHGTCRMELVSHGLETSEQRVAALTKSKIRSKELELPRIIGPRTVILDQGEIELEPLVLGKSLFNIFAPYLISGHVVDKHSMAGLCRQVVVLISKGVDLYQYQLGMLVFDDLPYLVQHRLRRSAHGREGIAGDAVFVIGERRREARVYVARSDDYNIERILVFGEEAVHTQGVVVVALKHKRLQQVGQHQHDKREADQLYSPRYI